MMSHVYRIPRILVLYVVDKQVPSNDIAIKITKAWKNLTCQQQEIWDRNATETGHPAMANDIKPIAKTMTRCVSDTITRHELPQAQQRKGHDLQNVAFPSHCCPTSYVRYGSDTIESEYLDVSNPLINPPSNNSVQYHDHSSVETSCSQDDFIGQEICIMNNTQMQSLKPTISWNRCNLTNQINEYRAIMKEYDMIVDSAVQERKKGLAQWYQAVHKDTTKNTAKELGTISSETIEPTVLNLMENTIGHNDDVDYSSLCETHQHIIDQSNIERKTLSRTMMSRVKASVMLYHGNNAVDDDDDVSQISCETITFNSLRNETEPVRSLKEPNIVSTDPYIPTMVSSFETQANMYLVCSNTSPVWNQAECASQKLNFTFSQPKWNEKMDQENRCSECILVVPSLVYETPLDYMNTRIDHDEDWIESDNITVDMTYCDKESLVLHDITPDEFLTLWDYDKQVFELE
jgi:hypothetical protein